MRPLDLLEFLVRRLYFANPRIVAWYQGYKTRRLTGRGRTAAWDPAKLLELLRHEIPAGADVMLHSAMAGLGPGVSPLAILDLFQEFCGAERTLLLPSHPRLKAGPDGILEYYVGRSPSQVGLVPEMARRTPGFLRSRHPVSSVLARGPSAELYIENNLNAERPLPHGVQSPYARLAARGGYSVCLGVPFEKSLTMMHVAEETLDDLFPVQLEFEQLAVRVVDEDEIRIYQVRRRRDSMLPHLSMRSLRRDLPDCGAVRRFNLGGVPVDVANCRLLVDYMRGRALLTGYPYIFLPRKPATHG